MKSIIDVIVINGYANRQIIKNVKQDELPSLARETSKNIWELPTFIDTPLIFRKYFDDFIKETYGGKRIPMSMEKTMPNPQRCVITRKDIDNMQLYTAFLYPNIFDIDETDSKKLYDSIENNDMILVSRSEKPGRQRLSVNGYGVYICKLYDIFGPMIMWANVKITSEIELSLIKKLKIDRSFIQKISYSYLEDKGDSKEIKESYKKIESENETEWRRRCAKHYFQEFVNNYIISKDQALILLALVRNQFIRDGKVVQMEHNQHNVEYGKTLPVQMDLHFCDVVPSKEEFDKKKKIIESSNRQQKNGQIVLMNKLCATVRLEKKNIEQIEEFKKKGFIYGMGD